MKNYYPMLVAIVLITSLVCGCSRPKTQAELWEEELKEYKEYSKMFQNEATIFTRYGTIKGTFNGTYVAENGDYAVIKGNTNTVVQPSRPQMARAVIDTRLGFPATCEFYFSNPLIWVHPPFERTEYKRKPDNATPAFRVEDFNTLSSSADGSLWVRK